MKRADAQATRTPAASKKVFCSPSFPLTGGNSTKAARRAAKKQGTKTAWAGESRFPTDVTCVAAPFIGLMGKLPEIFGSMIMHQPDG
jgi:hypothetical protein